ncbi:MAG: DUF1848 domain-containing protein [Candidatus Nitrospinota bacterium M3_3B_026]
MAVISASRRTDIPALHGQWLMDRFREGRVEVKNPYNGKISEISLRPGDVDGVVFWSRNYRPMLESLSRLSGMGYGFYCQYTIIGYPRLFDPGSPGVEAAAGTARELAARFGPDTVVWRYDPIILTSMTDAAWHLENFPRLLGLMEGSTDTCVISFIDVYRKVERNFLPLLKEHGAEFYRPRREELEELAAGMARMAAKAGITVRSCCEPELEAAPKGSCVDAERLGRVTDRDLSGLKKRPTREGCLCYASKDIGAYDTCTLGCAYCYANRSPALQRPTKRP